MKNLSDLLAFSKKVISDERTARFIVKITPLMRLTLRISVVLYILMFLGLTLQCVTLGLDRFRFIEEYNVFVLVYYVCFYYFLYLSIPALILFIILRWYNKYELTHSRLILKTESKLLQLNFILVLFIAIGLTLLGTLKS